MTLEEDLTGVSKKAYGTEYRAHVIELYKLYVEMSDRISERRQTGNSFFLTINSALVAFIGYLNLSHKPSQSFQSLWSISIAGMVLCYLWYRLIRSYKDINSGKFKVIHAIEKMLPLRPFDAEWTALGRETNSKLYLPFTKIEMAVPWVFFMIHLTVVIAATISTIG